MSVHDGRNAHATTSTSTSPASHAPTNPATCVRGLVQIAYDNQRLPCCANGVRIHRDKQRFEPAHGPLRRTPALRDVNEQLNRGGATPTRITLALVSIATYPVRLPDDVQGMREDTTSVAGTLEIERKTRMNLHRRRSP
jgi:hypothetical protein